MLDQVSDINFIPGWKNVTEQNQSLVLRFFWIFIVFSSIIACCLQITERINYFNSSSMSVAFCFELNPQIQFPYVVICPQYFSQLGLMENNLRYLEQIGYRDRNKLEICDLLNFGNITVDKVWHFTAHYLERIHFWFEDGFYGSSNVEKIYYDSIYGRCIITRAHLPINRAVSKFGGRIPAFSPDRRIFHHLYSISFHDNPILNDYDLLLRENLTSRTCTGFSLAVEKKTTLNTTRNTCVSSVDFYTCRWRCLDAEFNKKLNCRLPFVNNTNKSYCKTVQTCKTAMNLAKSILKSFDWQKCSCVKSCSSVTYKSFTAGGLTKIDEYFYGFRTDFKELQVQDLLEFESYTLVALMCDIGGTLGLFLGVCFLSCLEVLDACIFGSKLFRTRVQGLKNDAWIARKPLQHYTSRETKIWSTPHFQY